MPLSLFVTEALTNAMKYAGLGKSEIPRLDLQFHAGGRRSGAARDPQQPAAPDISTEEVDGGTGLGFRLLAAFAMQVGGTHDATRTEDSFVVRLRFTPTAAPDDESGPLISDMPAET